MPIRSKAKYMRNQGIRPDFNSQNETPEKEHLKNRFFCAMTLSNRNNEHRHVGPNHERARRDYSVAWNANLVTRINHQLPSSTTFPSTFTPTNATLLLRLIPKNELWRSSINQRRHHIH
mmetsp:Transcript_3177/g.6441  ORF Transcript_3177/g.6441 Transcript_3177/m.6441 type:complete len:119 (+) Transcript_3177:334-690(+)